MVDYGLNSLVEEVRARMWGKTADTQPVETERGYECAWNTLMDRCREFQRQVFGVQWPRDHDEMTQKYVMLITKELFEVLDHTSYKYHKPRVDIDELALMEEIADVQIFLFALAGMWFADASHFLRIINEKMGINERRLESEDGEGG